MIEYLLGNGLVASFGSRAEGHMYGNWGKRDNLDRLITLTTDFGVDDAFVGVMKGVILGINKDARIVDICHQVAPQNISEGSLVLASAYTYFPPDTVHLAVVDPGVGSSRRPIALATPLGIFVAPDNGLLSGVLADFGVLSPPSPSPLAENPGLQAVHLTHNRFWLPKVSATFHGRDIFAPVAAHLSLGVPVEQLGEAIDSLEVLTQSHPERTNAGMPIAHVVYVDRLGNLLTDARPADLPPSPVVISVKDQTIAGVSASYGEGGSLVALIGSGDRLEIALRNGSAASFLQAGVGDIVEIERTA
ncbi:MAG: SAM-dependent chlorinase/fluorinase [Dehalococcoidia bacterium]|nr:SAM-dependent chlorinase/fluorinase [Dehalococcoidia bacterium]